MNKKNALMLLVLPLILLASCTANTKTPGESKSTSIISDITDITEPLVTKHETIEIGRVTGDKSYHSPLFISYVDKLSTLDEEIHITVEFGTDFISLPDYPAADYAILEVAEVAFPYNIYEDGYHRSFRINDYSEYGGLGRIGGGEGGYWSGSTVIGIIFTGNDLTRMNGELGFMLRVFDAEGKEITEYYHAMSVYYVKTPRMSALVHHTKKSSRQKERWEVDLHERRAPARDCGPGRIFFRDIPIRLTWLARCDILYPTSRAA